jgi:hypothetical protein
VLLRIPQESIQDVILKKYEVEDEEDDMDDELDKEKDKQEKIKAAKKKTNEKAVPKKEWNVRLYFKMLLLFGSIAIFNLAYVSYGLTQIAAESTIFDTIKVCFSLLNSFSLIQDLDVVHQDVYEAVWQASGLFGDCPEGGNQLCDDFHGIQEILDHTATELNENFHVLLERGTGHLIEIFYGDQCLSSSPWKCDAELPVPEDGFNTGIPPDYAHFSTKGLSNLIDVWS